MSLAVQFNTMLAMIIMGSLFGVSLDTYNRFLKRSKRNRIIVFINDILFWLFQCFIIFYILFLVNHGEIRLYIFLALICGFAAYQTLFKTVYLNFLEKIIQLTIRTSLIFWRFIHVFIFAPIKWFTLLLVTITISLSNIIFYLVQIVGKMVSWLLSIIFKPLLWIGKGVWSILPNSSRNFLLKMYRFLASGITFVINKVKKLFQYLQSVVAKKK